MPKGYIYRQDGKPGIYLKFETFTILVVGVSFFWEVCFK